MVSHRLLASAATGRSRHMRPWRWMAAWLLVLSVFAQRSSADAQTAPTRGESAVTDEAAPTSEADEAFAAGLIMLFIVVAIGLLVIAGALIWGARVRRLVRQPAPKATHQDDLWYLRQRPAGQPPDALPASEASRQANDDGPSTSNTDDTRS